MRYPERKWTIHLVHHSHTDIGYTDRQERIERDHVDYIKAAIEISEASRSGAKPEWKGFHWTCETFWAVERFLERATPQWRDRLAHALQLGDLELSGSYLNMTELIDSDILRVMTRKAVEYGRSVGVRVDSAMTADINGYGWGYAQCLSDAGIQHLFSCVHPHHGMFALGRKQVPFWWETPKGDCILVWNGDHYNLGNELGLAPKAVLTYIIQDEFERSPIAVDHWHLAETRIARYLTQLEQEGYPFTFVPVMVSGLITDNAPPNGAIMDFINAWNARHGERISLEMTTLHAFFEEVKGQPVDLPIHRGDWPDWWSDGVASTPLHTQLFRDAQRTLRLVKELDPEHLYAGTDRVSQAEYQLMMYAEHTWGYSSSVSEPWRGLVQALGARKEAYAAHAHRLVFSALDDLVRGLGEAPLAPERPLRYKVINPFPYAVEEIVQLNIDYWELPSLREGLEVVDEVNAQVITHQLETVSRGAAACVSLALAPKEEKVLVIRAAPTLQAKTTSSFQQAGSDGVMDIEVTPGDASGWTSSAKGASSSDPISVDETSLETPHARIRWEVGSGIVSWIDKESGQEMLRQDRDHGAFTPVYERTPVPRSEAMVPTRTRMGRNRKGIDVVRTTGRLVGVKQVTKGSVFGAVELVYELPGTSYLSLLLTGYADVSRVDVTLRIHKDSVWEPENLYLALPFRSGEKDELWLEKTGAVLRPWKDQLPGTGTDFYCVQEGIAYLSEKRGLAIALPDTPLIQLGPLAYGPRLLQGHPDLLVGNAQLYAWVLNNFWETNFKATVGGFYAFRYFVRWGSAISSAEGAIQLCHAMNQGVVCFRLKS